MVNTIHFKNGKKLIVDQDTANIISQKLTAGSANYQSFIDANENARLIVNITQITHITQKASIFDLLKIYFYAS